VNNLKEVLNISSKSKDWRAKRLSNFSDDPFVIDGVEINSVEGFIQGIKFYENHHYRRECFRANTIKEKLRAQYLGRKMAEKKFVWWKGEKIKYGSRKHHKLIERAIRAKFEQNREAMRALLATRGIKLIHQIGQRELKKSSLPAKLFCKILTKIRKESF